MLRWTRNVPIFLRLVFVFVWATLIPLAVIIALSNTYFSTLQASGRALQTSNQAIKITTNELAHLQNMHALLVALLPSITKNGADTKVVQAPDNVIVPILNVESSFEVNSVSYQEQYELASSPSMADIRSILLNNNAQTTLISEQQQLLNNILLHQWPQYKVAQDSVLIALRKPITLKDAAEHLQTADERYATLLQSWQRIVDIAEQVNTEVVKVGPSQFVPLLLGALAAVLISMMIVFAIVYVVNRSITRPLYRLVGLTRRIVAGETMARSDLDGHNEIGSVATSMNNMLDHIVQLMQETRSSRDYLRQRVEKLIAEVKGAGEGDLRVRAEVTGDALGLLANSFNYMIDELGSVVVQIKRVAGQVEQSTGTILDQSLKLVKIGDTQIQQINSLNTSMEQMASASQEVARYAQSLYTNASETYQSASGGRLAVLSAVEEIGIVHQNIRTTARKVQLLGEVSQEINNIVEVIAGIAYQTNRLALDSAIQAAATRAYGTEFGSVASNIRRLAEQAKNQASTIARIVRVVREDISSVGTAMQDIER
ncbi:MAG: methyl-accepting chemotaxis protein, partial [Ktedonobacteraceae bacterium]|nr:methyl-accepting chemotaxis protein [Ktedonobacteraceae bacterium]